MTWFWAQMFLFVVVLLSVNAGLCIADKKPAAAVIFATMACFTGFWLTHILS